MKKRLMAAGLVVLMAATAFTGCSKVKKIDDSTEATTAEAETMARVDVDVDIPDFSSYVTLGDYTGIDIDVDSAEVTDKQLEQAKQNVIKNKTTQEHVTDRKVQDKDNIWMTRHLKAEARVRTEPIILSEVITFLHLTTSL